MTSRKIVLPVFLGVLLHLTAQQVFACDLCALHGAASLHNLQEREFRLGVSQQMTHFDELQLNGTSIDNPVDQTLDSSITQLYAEYAVGEEFYLQLNAPFIHRTFRRVGEDGREESGSKSGLGDIALLLKYTALDHKKTDTIFKWMVFGGFKFPTGDGNRLAEETEEADHSHEFDSELEASFSSGVHGHDLALGTGSFDVVLGTAARLQLDRYFAQGALQYIFRSPGDFDYEYADDLLWHFSPGAYLWLGHSFSLSLAARLSGEFKDKDRFAGAPVEDTRITTLYLGPELEMTFLEKYVASAAMEFPLEQEASSLQIVPGRRLIFNLSYIFS